MRRDRAHFIDEASRLEPFTGSLDALKAEYLEWARRRVAKDPTLPHNAWGGDANIGTAAPELGHNAQHAPSGQLQLDRDEENR